MAQNINRKMTFSEGFVLVAEDAQFASIAVKSGGQGAYLVGPKADNPAADRSGLPMSVRGDHLSLADGEGLFVKVEGMLILIAGTPLVADN